MSAPRPLQGVIVAGIACGLLFPTGKAVAQERTEVAEQFGCPTCHVTKLKEVRKPTGPLLVDPATVGVESYGKQESASTQRMCFSCHDGFVMDSRFAWSEGHMTHPVGVKPLASMKLPMVDDESVFPLNEDGEVKRGWGGRGDEPGQFNFPATLTLDASGRVLVVDVLNFRVQAFDADGTPLAQFGAQGAKPGDLFRPKGIAVDGQGRIFVSDSYLGVVQAFTADGQFIGVLGTDGQPARFQAPTGLAFGAGRLYVTDMLAGKVVVYELETSP